MVTIDNEARTAAQHSVIPLFAGLMVTMLLASLNMTVLSTSLPTIVGELHGADHMSWVITVFILASTIMMPIYGKLGDVFGRKWLLVMAIGIFMAGSVLGALAGSMTGLIVARAVQGLGAGGLMILAQASIADVIPARERGKYTGIMGAVFAVSSVAGPLLGGWLTEGPGWRWLFWMNLPLGALAVAAAAAFLPAVHNNRDRVRVDYAGMAVLGLTTTGVVLVASWGGSTYAWTSPTILSLIVATVLAAVVFVAIERRTPEPVMPLHMFADRNFNLCTAAGLLAGVAMFGAISYLPTYLQMAYGATATEAGLLMVPMMGALLGSSILSGQYVSRTGRYKALPIGGFGFIAAGLLLLSTVTVGTTEPQLCQYMAVMGVGLGATMQLLVLIVQNSFPVTQVGTATAANNYFRQIGATLGSAVVGSVFASRLTDLLAQRLPGGLDTAGGSGSLTPGLVQHLPDPVRLPIISSYSEALTPIFAWIAPLAVLAAVLLCFIVAKPLATTVDGDGTPDVDSGSDTAAKHRREPGDEMVAGLYFRPVELPHEKPEPFAERVSVGGDGHDPLR
ncbi:MAG: MDR family MFS transporter [Mycobacterium sp.]